jgi:WD40 repeat protein
MAVNPTERLSFSAPDSYPEGVAYDSISRTYFVSSARLGHIGAVSADGQYRILHQAPDLKSTYGVKLHPDGKQVLVCVGDANYSKFTSPETRTKLAKLIGIDRSSGQRTMDIDLSALVPAKHFVNDMAIGPDGSIYLTDSFAHAIYKVDANGKASVFSRSELFKTAGIGLNGIVYHPGGYLLAASSNTGQLYKIPMSAPDQVTKVKLPQFFLGADGLLLEDPSHLIMVVNGGNDKIFRLQSSDDWSSASMTGTTLAMDRFTYPATATFGDLRQVWVMNARFNELLDSNAVPTTRFAIQKAVFKPIPQPKAD